MYSSRHYNSYHFLLTLSDSAGYGGLEHHESSDNALPVKELSDDTVMAYSGPLLAHEYTHSWNGKYRRPAGLATADFATPMKGDLLWVYEGLTDYLTTHLAGNGAVQLIQRSLSPGLMAVRNGRTGGGVRTITSRVICCGSMWIRPSVS
jgi:predicted metalloprotease with PDZ domain